MADLGHLDRATALRVAEDPAIAFLLMDAYQREQQRRIRAQLERVALHPNHLGRYERRYSSQNGEDGILEEIFQRIGVTNQAFVEFGVEDGQVNNTRRLLEQGWHGAWFEFDPAFASAARSRFGNLPVRILERRITVENCLEVFAEAQTPAELDLLSIDIDGNDYWVWERINTAYRPRVVVIEYNAAYLPEQRWIMPYNVDHLWNGTNWFGASLTSLADFGEQAGYALVACDSQGVNAFFVRRDLLQGAFFAPGEVALHYCAPRYSFPWFGHPPSVSAWMPADPPYPEQTDDGYRSVAARWAAPPPASVTPAALFNLPIWLGNTGDWPITSNAAFGPPELAARWNAWRKPPWLVAQWYKDSGEAAPIRNFASFLAPAVAPGSEEWYAVTAQAPAQQDSYQLAVSLVDPSERIHTLLEATVVVE